MGSNSSIEWTHHTFNPWRGCTKVSPGCLHCYAEAQAKRFPGRLGVWGDGGVRVIASEAYWHLPLRWDRAAAEAGERHRVFCASLADWLESRPELCQPRARLLSLIEATPHLDWLLLTKRIEGLTDRLAEVERETTGGGDDVARRWLAGDPPANVWLGASVEDQRRADERIPHLLRAKAAVRFLSVEPLLGPLDLTRLRPPDVTWLDCLAGREHFGLGVAGGGPRIDWVIVGGESGPGARPMHPAWAESIRDQCQAAGVPFFFKQNGEFRTTTLQEAEADDPRIATVCRTPGDDSDKWPMTRVGKKAAGRLLDGRTWDEFPAPAKMVRA